ncbi:pentapeptide repeat-containing protein [Bacillus sp. RS11]|uniref:pentapeptide repeat-containing protein n=1 Tax=Lysinibacillus sp. RS11 TaxID=3242682 RepID=UPI0035C676EC
MVMHIHEYFEKLKQHLVWSKGLMVKKVLINVANIPSSNNGIIPDSSQLNPNKDPNKPDNKAQLYDKSMEEEQEKSYLVSIKRTIKMMNEKRIIHLFELHQLWLESVGDKGEKLVLDERKLESLNLSNFSFKEARLIGFGSMNLEKGNFILAWLYSSIFRNACLQGANFYKGYISYVDFTYSDLRNSIFTDCESTETIFFGSDLSDSQLNTCYFDYVDFRNSNFKNANIEDSFFFENVLVKGANFKGVLGLDNAKILSINIGTTEEPINLREDEAKRWIS